MQAHGTPTRYTSHKQMQEAMLKHQVAMDGTAPPVGYMKRDMGYYPPGSPEPSVQNSVTVYREKGQGLGLTFERCDQGLRLRRVAPHSTGDRAGLSVYIGRALEKVNGVAVAMNNELAAACESNDVLTFEFRYQRLGNKKKDVAVAGDEGGEAGAPPPVNYGTMPQGQRSSTPHHEPPQHVSARQFNEEKRQHMTAHGASPALRRQEGDHGRGGAPSQQHQPPPSASVYDRLRAADGFADNAAPAQQPRPLHPKAVSAPLGMEGRWICGDGTLCVVREGMATFGEPPEATERIMYHADTGVTTLLGATMVACTPYRVEWSDGDTWSRDAATHAPVAADAGANPAPAAASHVVHRVLSRTLPQEAVLGIAWIGSSMVVHTVVPHSPADRAGFSDFLNMHALAVNGVRYTDARALGEALQGGTLSNVTELHFTFEEACHDANVLV